MTYTNVMNQVTYLNRQLKEQYFTEKISSERGNMKATWQTLSRLLNKRSKSTRNSNSNVDGK